MNLIRLCGTSLLLLGAAACQSPTQNEAAPAIEAEAADPCLDPTINYPADLCVNMIEPDVGPAPEVVAIPLESCPDEGPRLPISNVCKGRAVNFMNTNDLILDAPDGCVWETQEVDLLLDEVLLYRSLTCGETETRLLFSAGAKSATLTYGSSALNHENGDEAVRIFGDGEANPASYIDAVADDVAGTGCAVMAANIEGWPLSLIHI